VSPRDGSASGLAGSEARRSTGIDSSQDGTGATPMQEATSVAPTGRCVCCGKPADGRILDALDFGKSSFPVCESCSRRLEQVRLFNADAARWRMGRVTRDECCGCHGAIAAGEVVMSDGCCDLHIGCWVDAYATSPSRGQS
jgi:hypothetical protein